MSALERRLGAIERRRSDQLGRLVCIKGTEGSESHTAELMKAAGLEPRPADEVVVICKPAGTGGADRVLSINGKAV